MAARRPEVKVLFRLLDHKVTQQLRLWPRELKLLKELRVTYPDLNFWLSLKPFIPLDSLLYFRTKLGQDFLQQEWQLYKFLIAQHTLAEEAQLDRSIDALEESLANSLDKIDKTPTVKRRSQNAIDWSDS